MIKKILDLHKIAVQRADKKKLVLAVAHDLHSLDAVYKAYKKGIIIPILVGDSSKIYKLSNEHKFDLKDFEIINERDKKEAVKIAVNMIRNGKADILMKGNVGTAILLKGILNDNWGLKTGNL